MNKKQTIRLNEAQLKQIVTEAVKKILREGKVVNNKPYFDKFYSNGTPQGKKVLPGEELYNGLKLDGTTSASDWDLRGNYTDDMHNSDIEHMRTALTKAQDKLSKGEALSLDDVDFLPNRTKLQNAMQKHNQRHANSYPAYEKNVWGSKEQQDKMFTDKKKDREKFAEMLHINGISLAEYKAMSEREKGECWEHYDSYNSPRARRARMWDEMGDPNWDNIYDNL